MKKAASHRLNKIWSSISTMPMSGQATTHSSWADQCRAPRLSQKPLQQPHIHWKNATLGSFGVGLGKVRLRDFWKSRHSNCRLWRGIVEAINEKFTNGKHTNER